VYCSDLKKMITTIRQEVIEDLQTIKKQKNPAV